MNIDVRELVADAERALRAHDVRAAQNAFVAAGDCAKQYGLWRSASRAYRRGLELDLVDREVVDRLSKISGRLIAGTDWLEYLRALDANPTWPHFGCRGAQVVIGDDDTVVTCPEIGPVLELMMSADDLVDVQPIAPFADMPRAMGLVILRRAMWLNPRDQAADPMTVRVGFAGRAEVVLDELGDWS